MDFYLNAITGKRLTSTAFPTAAADTASGKLQSTQQARIQYSLPDPSGGTANIPCAAPNAQIEFGLKLTNHYADTSFDVYTDTFTAPADPTQPTAFYTANLDIDSDALRALFPVAADGTSPAQVSLMGEILSGGVPSDTFTFLAINNVIKGTESPAVAVPGPTGYPSAGAVNASVAQAATAVQPNTVATLSAVSLVPYPPDTVPFSATNPLIYATEGVLRPQFIAPGGSADSQLALLADVPSVGTAAGDVAAGNDSRFAATVTPEQKGAVADGQHVSDGAMANGATTLTSASGLFTAADVGKHIVVNDSGGAAPNAALCATITAVVNATTITLGTPAPRAFAAAQVDWATDDSAAFEAAIASLPPGGGRLLLGPHRYGLNATVLIQQPFVTIEGVNRGTSSIVFDSASLSGSVLVALSPVAAVLKVYPAAGATTRLRGIEFRGFGILGTSKADNSKGIWNADDSSLGLGGTDTLTIERIAGTRIDWPVYIEQADSPMVRDSWFCEAGNGVMFSGGLYPTITGCTIADNSGYGVVAQNLSGAIVSHIIAARNGTEVYLDNATFSSVTNIKSSPNVAGDTSYARSYGIRVSGGGNNLVQGNVLGKDGSYAVAAICVDAGATTFLIQGNFVSSAPAGVALVYGAYGIVSGNLFDDSAAVPVQELAPSAHNQIYGNWYDNAPVIQRGANQMLHFETPVTLAEATTLSPVAFASRAASPTQGAIQMFSDSTTQTWGATITGGGSLPALGLYDGANWTVMGK